MALHFDRKKTVFRSCRCGAPKLGVDFVLQKTMFRAHRLEAGKRRFHDISFFTARKLDR